MDSHDIPSLDYLQSLNMDIDVNVGSNLYPNLCIKKISKFKYHNILSIYIIPLTSLALHLHYIEASKSLAWSYHL